MVACGTDSSTEQPKIRIDEATLTIETQSVIEGEWTPQSWGWGNERKPTIIFEDDQFRITAFGLFLNGVGARDELQQMSRTYAKVFGYSDMNPSEIRNLSDDLFSLLYLPVPKNEDPTLKGDHISDLLNELTTDSQWYKFSYIGNFTITDDIIELSTTNGKYLLIPYIKTANTLTLDGTIFIKQ
jgi:hypothetical protein